MINITTDRLLLREWKESDKEKYFQINQDPKVIEFLLGKMTMEQVEEFIIDQNTSLAKNNYALWAVEEIATKSLIGFIGLQKPSWNAHFTPCVEIGWRLGSEYWGKGYATEGARAVLSYGFNELGLQEIVSFTVKDNIKSRKVMDRLNMIYNAEDNFKHPLLDPNHPLSEHVLYRIKKDL